MLSAVIVYKKSLWTLRGRRRAIRVLPARERRAWQRSHREHTATLEHVMRVLREAGVSFSLQYRARLRPMRRASFVITLGGDGTFLRASHHVREIPLFGVNSDPATSVGFFCCATRQTFRAQLEAFLRRRLRITRLTRLQVRLNGRVLPELILNDCLMTQRNPAATSRYLLRVDGREEMQASSGLWVATPAGSTAAARSAGGWILPLAARQFEFVVREPFVRGIRPVRLWRGRVSAQRRVEALSLMPDGSLYLDGPHVRYPFRWGDRVVIRVGEPLRAVGVTRRAAHEQQEVRPW